MRDEMLLQSYKITRTLPCLADPMKIRVIAEVSEEIQEVFPYLLLCTPKVIGAHDQTTRNGRWQDASF